MNEAETRAEHIDPEDELRRLWGAPDTRKALLAGLAGKGFGREPLAEMQKIIEAENSDLFDVLAYVAFATRCGGCLWASSGISTRGHPCHPAIRHQLPRIFIHDS